MEAACNFIYKLPEVRFQIGVFKTIKLLVQHIIIAFIT